MSLKLPSSTTFAWLTSLFGRGRPQNEGNPSATVVSPRARVTLEDVRRASLAVASRSEEEILVESRRLGPLASDIVRNVGRSLTPETTTSMICDQLVREAESRGVLPAMLGYNGFPAAAAVSINDELLHGIPSDRRLLAGDLVKLEFGIVSGVAFGASSWTFAVGAPTPEDAAMLECGKLALRAAIDTISPDARLGDVGAAIHAEAQRGGLEVVREFVGYGMGRQRIQGPQVNGIGRRGAGARLHAGWILNLYVILKRGTLEVEIGRNGWTAYAADQERGCMFTCMVEVTKTGHRQLSVIEEEQR